MHRPDTLLEPHRVAVASRVGAGHVAAPSTFTTNCPDPNPRLLSGTVISCPSAARPSRSEGDAVDSSSIASPPRIFQRGASSTAWAFIRWSTSRVIVCTWPGGWIGPPMTPNAASGAPSRVTKPGMIVWNGRLLPGHLIRMAGHEREAGAAVLQADAGARHDDRRAEAHVVRLDQRNHHAARIAGRKIDGAALRRGARLEPLRAFRVDQSGALREVVWIQHAPRATRSSMRDR